MAAPSTQPKSALKGTIVLSDGTTPTPVALTIPFTRGDCQIGPLSEDLNEPVVISARGLVVGFTRGAPRLVQVSLSAYAGNVVGDDTVAPGSVLEFVTGTGAYAANVSTLGANRKMAVDVTLNIEGTDWGDSADETITPEDTVVDVNFQEAMDGNVISLTGQSLGNTVIDNDANTVTLGQAG